MKRRTTNKDNRRSPASPASPIRTTHLADEHRKSFQQAATNAAAQLVGKWKALACQAEFKPAVLARLSGVSLRTLERRFHAVLHQTPRAWLSASRLGHAEQRIAASLDPLKGIAVDLGFKHQTSFSKHFKKITSFSPTQFRSLLKRGDCCRGPHVIAPP
jgi:transcriptional regulator GlxA family with amidase domain